ncbi:hypothetical protein P7C70_g2365, partial [Phenoliferia sp. Uapishka_3]
MVEGGRRQSSRAQDSLLNSAGPKFNSKTPPPSYLLHFKLSARRLTKLAPILLPVPDEPVAFFKAWRSVMPFGLVKVGSGRVDGVSSSEDDEDDDEDDEDDEEWEECSGDGKEGVLMEVGEVVNGALGCDEAATARMLLVMSSAY